MHSKPKQLRWVPKAGRNSQLTLAAPYLVIRVTRPGSLSGFTAGVVGMMSGKWKRGCGVHTFQELGELLGCEGWTHFDANWVPDASDVLDVCTVQLAGAIAHPQKVGGRIVKPVSPWLRCIVARQWGLACHRLLVIKHECFVAMTTAE